MVVSRGGSDCRGIYAVQEDGDREEDFTLVPYSKSTLYRQKKSALKAEAKEINLVLPRHRSHRSFGVRAKGRLP